MINLNDTNQQIMPMPHKKRQEIESAIGKIEFCQTICGFTKHTNNKFKAHAQGHLHKSHEIIYHNLNVP